MARCARMVKETEMETTEMETTEKQKGKIMTEQTTEKTDHILDTEELLQEWLKTKLEKDNKFALSNYVKNNLLLFRGQTQKNKAVQPYNHIITALLLDTCQYLICKQYEIQIIFDITHRQIIFDDLQNIEKNITIKQKLYYNNYLDCNFGISEEEIKANDEKQKAEKMQTLQERQSIYDAYGIPVELAQY